MKKNYTLFRISFLLFALIIGFSKNIQAQPLSCPPLTVGSVTASATSLIVCNGSCDTLFANGVSNTLPTTDSYRIDSFPYNPYPYNGGTMYMALGDDVYGPTFTMPFPFCFFGTKYTTCLIGSNGEVGFDQTYANSGITWTYGAIPSAQSGEIGSVMYPYMDIYFPDGGAIYTAVYGTAPCRVFVVSGDSCSYFDGGLCPTQYITSQVVFHESTNQIDVNIAHKDVCTAWNSGYSTLGIENVAGTLAYAVAGKNATDWTATNLSYSFIPNGNSNNSITYAWYDTSTNTLIGTTDSLAVCPLVTTTYRLHIVSNTACDSFTADNYVTVQVGGGINISSESLVQPTTCGDCDGQIILHGITPFEVDTVFYSKNGGPQTSVLLTSAANGTLTLSNLCPGLIPLSTQKTAHVLLILLAPSS